MRMTTPGSAEPQLGKVANRGWYSRGYQPHADFPGLVQMISYRLADSIPNEVLSRTRDELRSVPRQRQEVEKRKRIERWLDLGHGCCALRQPAVAESVVETWQLFSGERYDLIAWVVMPNHVHVMIRTHEGNPLGKTVQSWKSYTGRRMAELGLGAPRNETSVWQRDYWDRIIRDEKHLLTAVEYIHGNPVKAGLVNNPEDWPWSSASGWNSASPEGDSLTPVKIHRTAQPNCQMDATGL